VAAAKPTPQQPEEGPGILTRVASAGKEVLSDLMKFTARSGSQSNFEALEPAFKNAVVAAAKEYQSVTGKTLVINSAKRDPADQQRLWDETVKAGRPGIGPSGMAVGRPGHSLHEKGHAVDIQNYQDPAAVAALNKQGLSQKVAGDPVHFTAKDGGIVPALPGGSKVLAGEAGQNEAIIPLKNGAVPVDMPKDFVDSMSKYNFLIDQVKSGFEKSNVSPEFNKELENIKSQAMASAGPGGEAMLAAFNQMTAELRAQAEANRSLFEAMLRGQATGNDIQSKLLKYAQ
jgi:hypothetical protein